MKKALIARDKRCRFPGCNVRASRTDGHHLDEWALGGGTEFCRSLCLCGFHHVRHHQGAFTIAEQPDGELHFLDRRRRRIRASEPTSVDPERGGAAHLRREHEARGLEIGMFTPLAQGAGDSFRVGPNVDAMLEHCGRLNGAPPTKGPPEPKPEPPPVEDAHDDEPDEDEDEEMRAVLAELRAEDTDDAPELPWPERDATDDELLRLMAGKHSVDPSELCRPLELSASETAIRLTKLELLGWVRQTATGYAATRAGPD